MPVNFDRIARRIRQLADEPQSVRLAVLQKECPQIVSQIHRDRGWHSPLTFWGRSSNVDENTGTQIVHPAILETLAMIAEKFGVTASPNAGLQHTYGYLFSTIQTPFGRKRDRWIEDSLEVAFGQPTSLFSPEPAEGTLLANVTWLAGSIAFEENSQRDILHRRLDKRVASSLMELSEHSLPGHRLIETINVPRTRRAPPRVVEFRTDLCKPPRMAETSDVHRHLLVYSVFDSLSGDSRLITLFLVSDDVAESIRSRANRRKRDDLRPRYNAVVGGLSRESVNGECRLRRLNVSRSS